MAKKKKLNRNMNMPVDMVEEILMNLPIKSLVRFLSVSTTWRFIISESPFVKRFGRRSALPDHERIALVPRGKYFDLTKLPACTVSSISSAAVNAAEVVVCPFKGSPFGLAFCHELWLVTSLSSSRSTLLYLWNPSMRIYKKLPNPLNMPRFHSTLFSFAYGLGYSSSDDDYKILKIPRPRVAFLCRTELYSLKSGVWREIQSPSREMDEREKGVFVSGHLHWRSGHLQWRNAAVDAVIAFDLNAEVFGEMPLPNYSPNPKNVHLSVLRGMLCVTLNYETTGKCDIWVMKNYGVIDSWSKMFMICSSHYDHIRPLYFYENGEILVRARHLQTEGVYGEGLYVFKDDKLTLQEVIYSSNSLHRHHAIGHGYLYAPSLVQP